MSVKLTLLTTSFSIYESNLSKMEPTAVITRIAPTFIRFGSFEIIKPGGPSAGKTEIATQLADYIIELLYTDINQNDATKYEQVSSIVFYTVNQARHSWQDNFSTNCSDRTFLFMISGQFFVQFFEK